MSGHSKWSQIKHKKGAADQKRGELFSKLLKNISIAARDNPRPEANPTLRAAIEQAREANVPKGSIERALLRGDRTKTKVEPLLIEAYGPGATALMIEALTDNKNRTLMEIRGLLEERGARLAEPGSARWAFAESAGWFESKMTQPLSPAQRAELEDIKDALEAHADVQRVITNAA